MEAKIEKQNAVDKIKNEKYREENQNRYQYKEHSCNSLKAPIE